MWSNLLYHSVKLIVFISKICNNFFFFFNQQQTLKLTHPIKNLVQIDPPSRLSGKSRHEGQRPSQAQAAVAPPRCAVSRGLAARLLNKKASIIWGCFKVLQSHSKSSKSSTPSFPHYTQFHLYFQISSKNPVTSCP